jgi:hypothetical protein
MHTRLHGGWLMLALCVGCGQTVNLDGGEEPVVGFGTLGPPIALMDSNVVRLAADDARLYWLETDPSRTERMALRSCLKDDCAATVVTYADSRVNVRAGFAVQGGELFFARQPEAGGGHDDELVAVRVDDPNAWRVLGSNLALTAIVTDSERVYYTTAGPYLISALPLADSASAQSRSFEPNEVPLRALAVHGDYLYWFGDAGDRGAVLNRALRDGSGVPEVITSGIQLDASQSRGDPDAMPLGLAVDEKFVYFSENILVGSVKRCPVSGDCAVPEPVVSAIRTPMGLLLDGSKLYIEVEHDAFRFGLAACSVEDCSPQMLNYELDTGNSFTVDDRNVYMATTNQPYGQSSSLQSHSARIMRLAKSIVEAEL